jgi:hypothetical protein
MQFGAAELQQKSMRMRRFEKAAMTIFFQAATAAGRETVAVLLPPTLPCLAARLAIG